MRGIVFSVRGGVGLDELQDLFRRAWDGEGKADYDRVLERAFTWITARHDDALVGFVNVAWDGGAHFFLLDTTVAPDLRQRGIGTALVRAAIDACRGHGEWIHVDAAPDLVRNLYVPAGFTPTPAAIAPPHLTPGTARSRPPRIAPGRRWERPDSSPGGCGRSRRDRPTGRCPRRSGRSCSCDRCNS
jgi:GNAT superfamily N-acetyltransferase